MAVNPLYNDVFVPKLFDVKLNFFYIKFKIKVNWYICENTIDVVKNFAVIQNVANKSFHCIVFFLRYEPLKRLKNTSTMASV